MISIIKDTLQVVSKQKVPIEITFVLLITLFAIPYESIENILMMFFTTQTSLQQFKVGFYSIVNIVLFVAIFSLLICLILGIFELIVDKIDKHLCSFAYWLLYIRPSCEMFSAKACSCFFVLYLIKIILNNKTFEENSLEYVRLLLSVFTIAYWILIIIYDYKNSKSRGH